MTSLPPPQVGGGMGRQTANHNEHRTNDNTK